MVNRISGVGMTPTPRVKQESHNLRVGLSRGKAAGRNKQSNIIQNGQEMEGYSQSSDVMYSIDGVDASSLAAFERIRNMSEKMKDPSRISRQDKPNTSQLSLANEFRKFKLPFVAEQEYLEDLFANVDWKEALNSVTEDALRQVLHQALPDTPMSGQMELTLMNWIKTIQTVGLDNINYELRRLMIKFQYQQKRKKNSARTIANEGLLDSILGHRVGIKDEDEDNNQNNSSGGNKKKKNKKKKGKK